MTNIEEEYLDKDFDYTKLTMVKLKRILFENGITDFPSNLKKQRLLEIYKENIHDKIEEIKKKRKKDLSKDKNKYQTDRSSIMDLEANENDQVGGIFTNGRTRRASSGLKDLEHQEVPVEERLKVIKNGAIKRTSLNEEHKERPKEIRPKSTSPIKKDLQNTSFLESIGTYLKKTSKRANGSEGGSPTGESPVKKEPPVRSKHSSSPIKNKHDSPIKKDSPVKNKLNEADKKKIYIDVDTSDFSNTSFFSYQTNTPKKTETNNSNNSKRTGTVRHKFAYVLPLFGILIMAISYVVFKSLPYCSSGDFFCINIPENGKLVHGKLACNKGFILRTSLFRDSCVKDDTKEVQMFKTIQTFIKKLEILRGNYVYGFTKNYKMKLENLTTDNDLIGVLRNTPGIVIEDGEIYSSNYRTTLRAFFKFYSTKAFYILIPLLLLVITAHFYQKRRLVNIEHKLSSKKIVKEILNILLRQLIMSTKNARFPSYVFVDQLKDVFVVDPKIWSMVIKSIESNSNVRKEIIENKQIWEWVGPLIQSTENLETLAA
ncbi:Inner nuclear membrane protein SRC1 [Nosema granulosis]|uniref:Inner nuclear membrane protein SRC1 n=1 Tax=Nosema granulosis TaxID=83296 RepID=A0A9P6GY69_9MICR|nr:Inner nuclear membrane protein SRC1 [Nosema granulosis]